MDGVIELRATQLSSVKGHGMPLVIGAYLQKHATESPFGAIGLDAKLLILINLLEDRLGRKSVL